jgi:hypothetical protein
MRPPAVPATLAAAFLLGAGAGLVVDRTAPAPSAEVARGSETAFSRGLYPRELPPGRGPQRWTTDRAEVRFRHLPRGPARLEVELQGHRGPVAVAVDGVVVGVMEPGTTAAGFDLPAGARSRDVLLQANTFQAGDGRRLGALLGRVTLRPARQGSVGALALFALPAAAVGLAAALAGLAAGPALLAALAAALVQSFLLWPYGLVRSPYADALAGAVALGAGLGLLFARRAGRRCAGAAPWAFTALLASWLVQGLCGTTPLMVVSDAVFHANKLAAVSGGDLFPTSVTQHARPFRIPYGVSFYALLVPFQRVGADPVTLVRVAGAVAGVAASCALFLLLMGRNPRAAAVAVVILQLLPATFDFGFSYGNVSNAFGQAMTVLFFAWWVAGGRAWPLGALLLVAAALSHFSSLVVLVALVAGLAVVRGRALLQDRPRLAALGVGLALAALYYAHYAPMVLQQVPRLLEGGGQGRGAAQGAWAAAWLQVVGAATQWGPAAVLLAWLGRPRPSESPLDRDLSAFWVAGLLLAIPAVLSPLEVRYLYALTLPLSAAAGMGWEWLHARGGAAKALAWVLLAAQAVQGMAAVVEAVLSRYRS